MAKKKRKIKPVPPLPEGVWAFDTHCHLDMSAYREDYDQVIKRSFEAGVKNIVTIGIDLKTSEVAIDIAERYDGIYAAVGVHPHNVEGVRDNDYQKLVKLSKHPKVVAYGEIGMDLVKKYAAKPIQEEHFIRQVKMAKDLDLPLIIHDREAHDDVMKILKAASPYPAGGIMHCYSGDVSLAKEVLELGFIISIPGVVTFNKAEMMQDVVREIPLESMVIETDGPFLTAVPMRGKRNEPAYVLYTAEKIAQLKGVSLEEVVKTTTKNAMEIFRLNDC